MPLQPMLSSLGGGVETVVLCICESVPVRCWYV